MCIYYILIIFLVQEINTAILLSECVKKSNDIIQVLWSDEL
jgi:hypothetical protein